MTKKEEYVVLVNEQGNEIGECEKLEAHRKGLLHLAFSIFIFNDKNEMLIQQRAKTKYHFAGLWSNACCSHPRPGEKIEEAAQRRLGEELGVEMELQKVGAITYSFIDPKSGLCEHEYDLIFRGIFSGHAFFDPEEIKTVRWIEMTELKEWMDGEPWNFTPWFPRALSEIEKGK